MNPIDHPLGDLDLPSKVPDERLQELIRKVRSGTATEQDYTEIAMGHIRLAFSIAVKYSASAPNLGEELVNEAVFGMALALSKARERLTDDSFTPYCYKWMEGFVKASLYKSSMVPIPYSTLKRRERQGIDLTIPGYTSDVSQVADRDANLQSLREQIDDAIRTDFEREVIARRALGKNDREIAAELNACRSSVNNAKLAVWKRFREQG